MSRVNVKELAAKGIVDGKPLREWVDAPHGEFAKAVRENIDPFFGLENEQNAPIRSYSVRINYSYVPEPEVEFASVMCEVEAISSEIAEDKTRELWDDGELDLKQGEDHEITSIGEPVLLP